MIFMYNLNELLIWLNQYHGTGSGVKFFCLAKDPLSDQTVRRRAVGRYVDRLSRAPGPAGVREIKFR